MTSSCNQHTNFFKALADETRLQVLSLLETGEKCACDLLDVVSISQSTLSHHMKILVNSKLVSARKEGKWTYYMINPATIREPSQLLQQLMQATVNPRNCDGEDGSCD